ncbi:Tetratricopeptide repeat protein 1 [Cytospora mali]|uniref:Tetratricopeptide repeat protein 1 n=1 Tax=Cytospora mali TaxID=578113 RepID=A0A194VI03_CYTMA|nr:Tetratricopeptide repeat protein 1 [Valsa mali]
MSGKATPADPAKIIKPEDGAEGDDAASQGEPIVKFSPEEEAELLGESNAHKTEANAFFNSGKYDAAIAKYDEAVSVCPNYLDFELAVLKSNVAACNLKLEEWKDAISTATEAIDKLDKLETRLAEEEKAAAEAKAKEEEVEEEIISAGAETAGPRVSNEEQEDPEEVARKKKREDIKRIRYKALIRRARARSEAGGWSNLSGAEEDYKTLSTMDNVTPSDRKIVQQQLRTLPAKVRAAQEKETTEMWGKLKDLGNGILKPFGLSTENFQMIQDPKTGGYSMNFKSE